MASILRMPGVSADSTEADLLEWSVSPGDSFKRGEPIAVVETAKATVELEAEEDAVLFRTFASPGESVTIGEPIAVLVQPGEETKGEEAILAELGLGSPTRTEAPPPPDEDRSQDVLVPGATTGIEHTADGRTGTDRAAAGNGQRTFASPLARRMAADAGLVLEDIEGTGPGGRITRRDVAAVTNRASETPPTSEPTPGAPAEAASTHPPAAAPSGAFTDIPHTKMRRAIAAALTVSKQQVPHFYLRATCRVDALLQLREQVNADGGQRVSINDFFVKATARALVDIPEMNVIWTPEAVRRFESVDIAVAVASERGLVTPVVRSVETRSLSSIATTIRDLSTRAQAGTLKQLELDGGSITVSNLGMFGVEEFSAIINPPQAGILAVGAVASRPTQAPDGSVEFGRFVTVVLSVDHRPVDGVQAARWLERFTQLIEAPLRLLV